MSSQNNYWKVFKLFTLAAVAAAFSSSLSQAIAARDRAISELTIEERLTKVREVLEQRKQQSSRESYTRLSPQKKARD